ncbi:MAG: DUF2059 domain-containing protein [Formosimonas sp.]
MFKKYMLVLGLAAGCFMPMSHAQMMATEKSVMELMEVTREGEFGLQGFEQMLEMMKLAMPHVSENYLEAIKNKFTEKRFLVALLPVVQKHYTEEEVQGLIAFYQTPLGQKLLQKSPVVMREGMEAGERLGEQIAQEVLQEMKRKKR